MSAEESHHASWRIGRAPNDGAIWLKFVGRTPTEEVRPFLDTLTATMPRSHAKVVFDLRELNGYNPDAKLPIKSWLLEHKLRLDEVTVIIPKSGVWLRMVTAAIGLAVSVKIRIRDELYEGEEGVTFMHPSHANGTP
jgi:hypothetical protein